MVNEKASVSKAVVNVFFDFLVFCLVSGLTVCLVFCLVCNINITLRISCSESALWFLALIHLAEGISDFSLSSYLFR